MPVVYNYIDESERTFLESGTFLSTISTLWTSDGTINIDPVVFQDAKYGSLEVTPVTNEMYLSYNMWDTPATDIPSQYAITTAIDAIDRVESFMWVKPTVTGIAYLKTTLTKMVYDIPTQKYMLSTDPNDIYEGEEGSNSIAYGGSDISNWHLIRSIPISIPNSTDRFSIGLTLRFVANTATNLVVNVSRPTIITSAVVFRNQFLQYVASFMPSVFFESDFADFTKNEPIFPLTHFVDVCTEESDNILTIVEDITYVDISQGRDDTDETTYSQLVNPSLAPEDYLQWQAQFRGRQLLVTYEPSTEGESWDVFRLDQSALDTTGVIGAPTSSLTVPGGVEEYFRWQVESGAYGHNAGTVTSMVSAIQRVLTGARNVNYTVTANNIHFETSYLETQNAVLADVGNPSPLVLQIVEPARPLGMVITHELTL